MDLLVGGVDNSSPSESKSFHYVKQETDEMVDLRNESMLAGSIPNEFYNEEKKYIIDQMRDENFKVWPEEVFLTTWKSLSVKSETSEDCNTENASTEHIFSKCGVKKELYEMKVEEIMEDFHLIRDKNHHMQTENTAYTKTNIEDISGMPSSIELELTQEKCDLRNIDSIYSVKTETNEDLNVDEESNDIINQMIDENGKVWPKEDFLTFWNSVKMEESEHSNSKTECSNSKMKDVREMLSSIQMEPSSPKSNIPSNLDSIHLENHKRHSCDYNSSQRVPLQLHIKSVHLKLRNHKCHVCDYSSLHKQDLQKHIESIHLKLKNHKCYLCDYSTSRKDVISKHIKSVHLKLKNHKCHLCDYCSSHKQALRTHLKSVHLKLKNHKCDLCDFSSSLKGQLLTHIKAIHLKLKSHKCHLCDYSSSLKEALQKHIKSFHLNFRNHKCNLCDYSSSDKGVLQRHIKSIHLKLKNHTCNLCAYSSSRKGDLQIHIKSVHLKKRNYECHSCNYSSSRKYVLKMHIKSIHLKLKKHKCHLCDFSSSRKDALQMHLKSIHWKLENLCNNNS